MKTTSYYVKSTIFAILLLLESAYLTHQLLVFAQAQDYFTPEFQIVAKIAANMLLLAYTYSLSIGGWNKWEQFVLVPLPVSVGIIAVMLAESPAYAFVVGASAFLFICYDVLIATKMKNNLINFNPRLAFRFSVKSLFLMFSLIAAVFVLAKPYAPDTELNLVDGISDLITNNAKRLIMNELNTGGSSYSPITFGATGIFGELNTTNETKNSDPQNSASGISGADLPTNSNGEIVITQDLIDKIPPEIQEQFGVDLSNVVLDDDTELTINASSLNLDAYDLSSLDALLGNNVDSVITERIEPYKRFVPTLAAILVFGFIEFIGLLVYVLYMITIDVIFVLANLLKIYRIEPKVVEQKVLRF